MAEQLDFVLNLTDNFKKTYKKIVKNEEMEKRIFKTLEILKTNPYHPSLRTHKVKKFRSSWVHGDLRIIWQFSKNEVKIIDILDLGNHGQVY